MHQPHHLSTLANLQSAIAGSLQHASSDTLAVMQLSGPLDKPKLCMAQDKYGEKKAHQKSGMLVSILIIVIIIFVTAAPMGASPIFFLALLCLQSQHQPLSRYREAATG